MGLAEKEKELLKQGLSQQWDWSWGLNRMRVLDPSYDPEFDFENFVPEPDVYPETQQEILKYSRQYQEEWRFEREYRLIEHALRLFPGWHYLHERKEWHSRPIFHRDPEKSRVQPRKPLHLPRDPNYIPKQETIDSMCFVTGASSNAPYFDLCVQLIESIKATRWYNHVPIKVLDCGLTHEDAEYLRNRFEVEVKDPGWDVDPAKIKLCDWSASENVWGRNNNAVKGISSRHCLYKHFPEYRFFCWLDCDLWVQDEYVLDYQLWWAEYQGFGVNPRGCRLGYEPNDLMFKVLPQYFSSKLVGRSGGVGAFFIHRYDFQYHFSCVMEKILEEKYFTYGTDDYAMSATIWEYYDNVFISEKVSLNSDVLNELSATVDFEGHLKLLGEYIGTVSLLGPLKRLSYHWFFGEISSSLYQSLQKGEEYFKNLPAALMQEMKYGLCQKSFLTIGSLFYRTYLVKQEGKVNE